ncbi:hypothetical protein AMEX_G3329, partial [Astyanax mexicanus]
YNFSVSLLDGPVGHTILGPDAVTVGVPSSFLCSAQCSPECSYAVSIDNHSVEQNELAFTLSHWEGSKTVTCTAQNSVTGSSSTVRKTLHILEGPVNISISGPQTLTPGETQRFLCTATCRPFCIYTWIVDGDSIAGSGDEVVFRPPLEATSGTLICKATNSVSGLFSTTVLKLSIPTLHISSSIKYVTITLIKISDCLSLSAGPEGLSFFGPDAVTVGVPSSIECFAQCSPECNYTIGFDGQSLEGNELAFTLKQWVSSITVTCTAKNPSTQKSSSISKTLQILEGPVNVSISGPITITPGESQRFLCSATCRPSCNYTWVVDGESVAGSGNEVIIKQPKEATAETLVCKATNSISGLFVTAIHKLGSLSKFFTGPEGLSFFGPDAVTVGVPSSIECFAQCSPECNYTIGFDGQSLEGNELAFTLKQWVSSITVTCTAKNPSTQKSSSISKTLQILEGPVNVSISGPFNITSGDGQQFLCSATCRPSCNYTWVVDGESVAGSGNEVIIKQSIEATAENLVCQATNSISGLFVTAIHEFSSSRDSAGSSSEKMELLPKLLFSCMMSVFLLVVIPS